MEQNGKSNNQQKKVEALIPRNEVCGIIMPIADTPGYISGHWQHVKLIVEEAIVSAGFIPNLVSDADEIGIIHNRIVNNIYENAIVVCDVSSKNPNVMFELGMRLAFDKPTIIINDELTNYTFDVGIIEHLGYPSDLNYHLINNFKNKLELKLKATFLKSTEDKNFSPFLKNFVQYKKKLEEKEVSIDEIVLKKLDTLDKKISILSTSIKEHESVETYQNPIIDEDEKVSSLVKNYFNRYVANKTPSEIATTKDEILLAKFQDFVRTHDPGLLKVTLNNLQTLKSHYLREKENSNR